MTAASDSHCPCGSGKPLSACRGPFCDGAESPETAEALMRSRYTAYCLARGDYLWATWHHTTRRQNLDLDAGVNWLGLKIVHTESGGPKESAGLVEFVARYRIGGRPHRLHVIGRFSRRDGRRLHRDGEVQP